VKGEEFEIPEYLRSSITNKESEEKIRDMVTRLDGFDGIKEKRDEAVLQNSEYEKTISESNDRVSKYDQYLGALDNMINQKDYDNFFKQAKISEDEILNHAQAILDRRDLSYQEQQSIQQQNDRKMQQYATQQQVQDLTKQNSSREEELSNMEIEAVFSRSEVAAAEKELDARLGKPNSFKRVVGEIGAAVYGTKNQLTVLQATEEAIKRFGLNNNNQAAPAVKQVAQPNPSVQQKVVVKPNVMPNVGSGASAESVVSKELSPDDLDRMELNALSGKYEG